MFRYLKMLPVLALAGTLGLIWAPEAKAQTAGDLDCNKCVDKGNIARKAVTKSRIKKNAVTGAKIKDGSVGLGDLSAEVQQIIADLQAQVGFGGSCPAFNSTQVDATMMAINISQIDPLGIVTVDFPSDPFLECVITTDENNDFLVAVGDRGEGNEVLLLGELGGGAILRTRVQGLTTAELHACRAQVLGTFVWNQYCAPALP